MGVTEDAADSGGRELRFLGDRSDRETLGERLADRVVAGYKGVIKRRPPLFDVVRRGGDVVQAHDRDVTDRFTAEMQPGLYWKSMWP